MACKTQKQNQITLSSLIKCLILFNDLLTNQSRVGQSTLCAGWHHDRDRYHESMINNVDLNQICVLVCALKAY